MKTQESQPIIDILRRVSVELDDAARLVDELHLLVKDIDRTCVAQKDAFMHSAQSIDIVQQRLSGLSHFICELVELMPSHWVVEGHAAANKLKLTRLAERLTHQDAGAEPHTEQSGGDLELL